MLIDTSISIQMHTGIYLKRKRYIVNADKISISSSMYEW